ncbi:DUF445 domain-containing protein [Salinicoccus kekensis]|uniref:Uncharacterized membrane protein YheB (UPF0754 family) n=1 Tax=Salinicoccus kekensis TaxID=714307 RepID=A0A285UC33_9STAP|nr:DUF445 family protein [Salinicoccus kekensis]SOC39450.1 uncharacterized membrane protein YheB (UPF0754 family) [Salinicoccus kekensis]
MNTIGLIIFMVVTGSLIAGFTNMLAIRMLFRPYEAKYLFGIKLPFTPGVIPSRRSEASTKLGRIITGHLLTPDVFIDKVKSPETDRFIMNFIDRQIRTIEEEKLSIGYFLERLHAGLSEKVITGFNAELENKISEESEKLYISKIEDLMPRDAMHTIDMKVAELRPQLTRKLEEYMASDKGYEDLYTMTDEFIEKRGRLAKSLKYFMTKENITLNIRKELMKLIHHPKMVDIMEKFIIEEYRRVKGRPVNDFLSEDDKDGLVISISSALEARIDVRSLLDKPIIEFNREFFDSFKERGKYTLKDNTINYLAHNMGRIMDKLQLAEVIKKQIDSFELAHIEDLVMDVAKKEFQMITLLGFILGAVIGLFQGIVVVLL